MPHATLFSTIQSRLSREIWILTAAHQQQRGGLTATWVSPASLDPAKPILLVALSLNHFTTELVRDCRSFVAHLLRPDQASLAWDFARDSGRERDKLADYELLPLGTPGRGPVLQDCLAWLDCRVISFQTVGERLFVWADVVASKSLSPEMPLTDQAFFSQLSTEQRTHLASRRAQDILEQTPLHQQWRLESLLKLG